MQTESYTGDKERETLASVLFDDRTIATTGVVYRQRSDLFHTAVANRILQFAMKYYEQYRHAPGYDVMSLVALEKETNPGFASQIEQLLSSLSAPSTTNSEMLADNASAYFERVHLEKTIESLSARIKSGQVDECYEQFNKFHRLSTGLTYGVNPIVDIDAVEQAFLDTTGVSLIDFENKDANEFFGDTFSRSSFVVFNASEKSGKSHMLLDLALRALRQGRSVAYFEAGDMSQNQVIRRIYQRLAQHPRRAGSIEIPTSVTVIREKAANGVWEQEIDVQYAHRHFETDLDEDTALAARDRWLNEFTAEKLNWRFSAHAGNLSVPDIYAHLDEWERVHSFIPDFIFIDYADLLIPAIRNTEYRHQINDTFARLRGLSLAKKCCLVTATQGNAATWKENVMTRDNLAEDKRKAAHPTAILGISASEVERSKQVAKLNYLVRRDDVCNESDFLYLGQCLAICAPMICFFYPNGSIHRDGRTTADRIFNVEQTTRREEPIQLPAGTIDHTRQQSEPERRRPRKVNPSIDLGLHKAEEDDRYMSFGQFDVLGDAPEGEVLGYPRREAKKD